MRDDDQVKAALAIKKDLIVNSGWAIHSEDKSNIEAEEFITNNLEQIGETDTVSQSFDDILRNMLTSFDYGFSLTEPVYELRSGKYYYKTLKTRPPHPFKFYLDDFGNITKISQMSNFKELYFDAKLFMHYVYQPDFGNPYGKSDLRSAHAAWKAKKFFTKFYAMYVERFATPTAIAKYPKTFNTQEVEQLNKIIKTIKTSTSATVPEGVIIEFLQNARDSTDAYIKGLEYFNMQIARSILMPDLIGLSGGSVEGGSYALGKEQFKLFLGILKKEREALARKITIKIVRPLAYYNFGDFPIWFEFKQWTTEDIKDYLTLWVQAVTNKIYTPNDNEIIHFRTSLGFPDGEVTRPQYQMQSAIPSANPNGANAQGLLDKQEPEPQEPEENEEEDEEVNKADDKSVEEFALTRPLTTYEKKIDFQKIKQDFDNSENRIVYKLSISAKEIYADLIIQTREKHLLTKFQPERIETLKPKYMRDMNTILKNYFTDLYKISYEQARKEILPNTDTKFAIDMLPEQFVELLKAEAFKMVGDYTTDLTKKAKNIIMQGIKDGYGEADISRIMRDEFSDYTDKWLKTVVRTKSTEIYNEARKSYWENDEYAKEIVAAYEWSAILDDRTSDVCRELDGKIFDIGEYSDVLKPPAHFNCRSILVPITKFEDYKDDKNYRKSFNIDKLIDMGGGLLAPAGNTGGKKYAMVVGELIRTSHSYDAFGEYIAVASGGTDKAIGIINITISNKDMDKPVTVSLMDSITKSAPLQVTVSKAGGLFTKQFSPLWELPLGADFLVSISAPVLVDVYIEYYILVMQPDQQPAIVPAQV